MRRPFHHYLIDAAILIMVVGFLVFVNAVCRVPEAGAATLPHDRQTCAFINNTTNTAAWVTPIGTEYHVFKSKYTDYGDNLGFEAKVPRAAWPAINAAVAKLHTGPAGHKIARACA